MIERVALGGAMASGKTACANRLESEHGFTKLGFASPLYEIDDIHKGPIEDWFRHLARWGCIYLAPIGLSDGQHRRFIDETFDAFHRIPATTGKNRTLLQHVGTEVGRAIDEDLWVRIFAGAIENAPEETKIVNDNLRFYPNEFDCLASLGFTTVYIEAPEEVRFDRYLAAYGVARSLEQKSHSSESHLGKIKENSDYIYSNTGTLEDLYNFLDRLVDSDFRGEHAKESKEYRVTERVRGIA